MLLNVIIVWKEQGRWSSLSQEVSRVFLCDDLLSDDLQSILSLSKPIKTWPHIRQHDSLMWNVIKSADKQPPCSL